MTYEFRFYAYPPGRIEVVRVRSRDLAAASRLAHRIVLKRLGPHVLTQEWQPGVVIESPER